MQYGRWRLTYLTMDGPVVGPWRANTIQIRLYALTQALLNVEPGYAGWQYIAIGTGSVTWDGLVNPPPAEVNEVGLIDEFARIPITAHHYIDERDNIVLDLTRVVQVQGVIDGAVLGETLHNPKPFRELALVGGNATAALGSGMYLAIVRIPREVRYVGDDPQIITVEIEL